MYHDVVAAGAEDTSGFPGRDAALYKITPELFDAHLEAIVRACRPSPPPITFDDGGASALAAAAALERHGLRGTFFVTTDCIGRPGFVDEAGVRELRQRGHVIGSHSCSHPLRMGHCPWPQLVDEWRRSVDVLSRILGEPIAVASVPGGDFTPAVAQAAAGAGIRELFTSEPSGASVHGNGLALRGRFVVRRWTSPATAAGLASGAWLPRAQQVVSWNVRKAAKRIGGERYLHLRRLLLAAPREHGPAVADAPAARRQG